MKSRLIALPICLFLSLSMQGQNLLELLKNIKPEDRIAFALYTVHENILKLNAQFYPLKNFEPFKASLEIEDNGKWVKKAEASIQYPGYTALFRIEDWDDTKERKYKVVHNDKAFYEGIIRKNPIYKDEFILAAFTCNSIYPKHGGDIPRTDIVDNIKKIQPD
ncbi:hypothetical protein N9Q60_01980, partial [Flavobacteriaceae bacterium]|nr:hypothetical protein [Flavobacteriaceae bacterium]